jgi:hypothetical protein
MAKTATHSKANKHTMMDFGKPSLLTSQGQYNKKASSYKTVGPHLIDESQNPV